MLARCLNHLTLLLTNKPIEGVSIMKLCWDNIENIRLSKYGNFRDIVKNVTYYLKVCEECGDEFLSLIQSIGKFCSTSCGKDGSNNPMYGKYHTEETKRKLSENKKNSYKDPNSIYNTDGYRNKLKGKKRSNKFKKNQSEIIKKLWKDPNSKYNSIEYRESLSERLKIQWMDEDFKNEISQKISLSRSGYASKGLPLYDTYAPQIEWCEEVRRNKNDPNVLEVRCFKCDKWFIPSLVNAHNRSQYIKGNYNNENRFYCSNSCKNSCSIFNKSPEQIEREDAIRAGRLQWLELQREVQPELRQMVLERDEYECVKCGSTNKLQCHHIQPVSIEPLLSADIDNCITLCSDCHKETHQQDGCRYGQLRIEEC